MRRSYAFVIAGGAVIAALAAMGSVECSSTTSSDAGDSGDSGGGKESGPTETGAACAIDPLSVDDTSYWLTPGWELVGGAMRCCPVAAATNPAVQLPTLTWVPCANGASDCLEVQHNWRGAYDFGLVSVSRNAQGGPQFLDFTRQQVGTQPHQGFFEEDIYDFATSAPVAGWRQTYSPPCLVNVTVGGSGGSTINVWTLARDPEAYYVGTTTPPNTTLPFEPLVGELEATLTSDVYTGANFTRASTTSFAFDLVMGWNGLVRMPLGDPSGYVMSKPPYPDIHLETLEGDDVYGYSYATSTGWQAIYVMAADGTMNVYLAKDKTNIAGVRSDGKNVFWVEMYGLPDPHLFDSVPQPNMDVWAAPYTSDPALVAATGTKIASIPNGQWAEQGVAFDGLFAFPSDKKTVSVVRLSDGAVQQVSAGAGRSFNDVFYVSPSEVWATMDLWNDDAGTRGRTVALARYALHDW